MSRRQSARNDNREQKDAAGKGFQKSNRRRVGQAATEEISENCEIVHVGALVIAGRQTHPTRYTRDSLVWVSPPELRTTTREPCHAREAIASYVFEHGSTQTSRASLRECTSSLHRNGSARLSGRRCVTGVSHGMSPDFRMANERSIVNGSVCVPVNPYDIWLVPPEWRQASSWVVPHIPASSIQHHIGITCRHLVADLRDRPHAARTPAVR